MSPDPKADRSRPPGAFLTLCCVLVVVWAPAARAQDDEIEPDVPQEGVQMQQNFGMDDSNFEQWVFNNGSTAAQTRTKFESLLALHVEDVDRSCGLTEAQKQKLRLAGQGDVKRFFDLIDEKRRQFKAAQNQPNQFNNIWQEIQPLQAMVVAGLFGDASVYRRSVRQALNPEQLSKYDAADLERRRATFHARVMLVVSMLDGTVGFRDDQRQRFVKVLTDEIVPPGKTGQQDYYFILYLAAQVPEAKLKPIFDEGQWKALHPQLEQTRGFKEFLKTNGYLPADEAAALPPAAAPVVVPAAPAGGFQ